MSKGTLIIVATALVAGYLLFMQMLGNIGGGREGWQPFAWYGYPGEKPGSVGYQARGDWCGIQRATTGPVPKPLPLIAPRRCASRRC
jgi:hypothetical protein